MSIDTPSRSHVLITLGVLFTLGGASRFVLNDIAAAEEAPAAEMTAAPQTESETAPGDIPASPAEPDRICFTGETAEGMMQDQLLFEEQTAELREQRLELEAWSSELERQTAELAALQQTLEVRWREMQTAADEDMEHLARMYGAMKPGEAAAIFDQMDPAFAAGFLRLLPSEQAGQILAGMGADRAYTVSVELASLNPDIRRAPRAFETAER